MWAAHYMRHVRTCRPISVSMRQRASSGQHTELWGVMGSTAIVACVRFSCPSTSVLRGARCHLQVLRTAAAPRAQLSQEEVWPQLGAAHQEEAQVSFGVLTLARLPCAVRHAVAGCVLNIPLQVARAHVMACTPVAHAKAVRTRVRASAAASVGAKCAAQGVAAGMMCASTSVSSALSLGVSSTSAGAVAVEPSLLTCCMASVGTFVPPTVAGGGSFPTVPLAALADPRREPSPSLARDAEPCDAARLRAAALSPAAGLGASASLADAPPCV